MKALSIRQPWAWAIVNGWKTIENRKWQTRYRGPLLIHAGARTVLQDEALDLQFIIATVTGAPDVRSDAFEALRVQYEHERTVGAIVGTANMVDCLRKFNRYRGRPAHEDPWWAGPYGFVLEDARPLLRGPIPFRGRLGIFEVPFTVGEGASSPFCRDDPLDARAA